LVKQVGMLGKRLDPVSNVPDNDPLVHPGVGVPRDVLPLCIGVLRCIAHTASQFGISSAPRASAENQKVLLRRFIGGALIGLFVNAFGQYLF
jgi:hypothetical protein